MGVVISRAALDALDADDPYARALADWAESLQAWHVEFEAWDSQAELRHPPRPPNTSRWSTKVETLMEQRRAAHTEAAAISGALHARWASVNESRKAEQKTKAKRRARKRLPATQSDASLADEPPVSATPVDTAHDAAAAERNGMHESRDVEQTIAVVTHGNVAVAFSHLQCRHHCSISMCRSSSSPWTWSLRPSTQRGAIPIAAPSPTSRPSLQLMASPSPRMCSPRCSLSSRLRVIYADRVTQ